MNVWLSPCAYATGVYHRWGSATRTACGRALSTTAGGRWFPVGNWVPLRFLNPETTRPCRRCWPE